MALRKVFKFSILGGTLYLSEKSGVWGDTTHVLERVDESVEKCLPLKHYLSSVPDRKEVDAKMVDSWNNGVKYVFKTLLALPEYTRSGLSWCSEFVAGLVDIERKHTD